jgi:proline dehydrogenase
MRPLLLWMARNPLLKRWLPRIWFVRRAVRRFMPGETVEEALDAAEFFRPHGIGILFTQLGENLTKLSEAEAVAQHYHRLLDLIAYGEAWYAWYMRRLAERPANDLFALRQIFG